MFDHFFKVIVRFAQSVYAAGLDGIDRHRGLKETRQISEPLNPTPRTWHKEEAWTGEPRLQLDEARIPRSTVDPRSSLAFYNTAVHNTRSLPASLSTTKSHLRIYFETNLTSLGVEGNLPVNYPCIRRPLDKYWPGTAVWLNANSAHSQSWDLSSRCGTLSPPYFPRNPPARPVSCILRICQEERTL